MMPRVYVLTIAWNEAEMMPYWLRHYSTFADKLVIYLEPSSDGTDQIVKSCPKADLRKWPWRGLDDNRFAEAANSFYKEFRGKTDFVIFADVDEILYCAEPLKVLSETKADVLSATGWGMITQSKLVPTNGQIYETYRTGVRQENYDKALIWRPNIDIQHTHGRHTYPNQWPKHNGVQTVSAFKLLHYHYFGVEYTAQRNRRNYARAVAKNFAWNYSEGHNNNPKQVGSVAWVRDAIENNKLIDVFTAKPIVEVSGLKKVQFGSGSSRLPGFDNRDIETDIRKKLPFQDGSVSHIVAEHVCEHLDAKEAWNFFVECHRILAKGGRIRIAIPDFTKLEREMIPEYQAAVKAGGHGDGSKLAALKAVIFEHGHRSVWNSALLFSFLKAIGFTVTKPAYGESTDPVLVGSEQHWKVVTKPVAENETSIIEGVKP